MRGPDEGKDANKGERFDQFFHVLILGLSNKGSGGHQYYASQRADSSHRPGEVNKKVILFINAGVLKRACV
jgi:hypothetical protein